MLRSAALPAEPLHPPGLGEPVREMSAEAGSSDDVRDADANRGEAFLHE
jgi:hypothetical protein